MTELGNRQSGFSGAYNFVQIRILVVYSIRVTFFWLMRLLSQTHSQVEAVDGLPQMSRRDRHISNSEQKLSSSHTFKLFKNLKKKWKSSFSLRDNQCQELEGSHSNVAVNKKLGKKTFSLCKLYKHKSGLAKHVSISKLFKKRINKVKIKFFRRLSNCIITKLMHSTFFDKR
ncbi:hypothetical protein BpHYR1_013301 [Brachionus plicatilis]|uniref:Uncharacterized protein n=1 Tax=Brachionus plicatilis TaxID=10195 RepID=A0A3M7R5D3_BRAPC|nr:hypothetical protein BpHYR1_013301 [Brachionus plicatilis]